MPQKNIVWLASYPKSGNTWVRIFLANYLFDPPEPLPINQIHRLGIGDSVPKTYLMVSKGKVDLSDYRATLGLRGKVLRRIAANDADINFVKTHNERGSAFGVDLIPAHLTRSAIYIVRNPLDVVLSYARHYGLTPERAAIAFSRKDNVTTGAEDSVAQFLGSWSGHVQSWTRARDFPVHVVRYEDMLAEPEMAFSGILREISVEPDPARLEKAIRFASFKEVSAQEAKDDFVERSPNSEKFFHSGQAGAWKTALAPEIAEKIRLDHRRVMTEFGYL